jgi:hypothetical protein
LEQKYKTTFKKSGAKINNTLAQPFLKVDLAPPFLKVDGLDI